ncbi:MAG: hypothetical protein ACK5Y2_00575 [Bdellovibrionales bacterium]
MMKQKVICGQTMMALGFAWGLCFQSVQAQTVMEKIVTVEHADTSGKVSVAELTEMANKKLAEDMIVDFIGAEAYNRNKAALAKVVNNSSRFAPFQKVQDVERGAFGARLTMQYKVSVQDFRKLLADAGLFSRTRLAQNVIAFFVIEDELGSREALSWKKMGTDEQQVWLHDWMGNFRQAFEKAGYTFNKNLNPAWVETFSDGSSPQDVLDKNSLSQSLILWGTGKVEKDPRTSERMMTAQVRVFSQEFKREVTDSVRRFRLRDESQQRWQAWGQDLVSQIDEVDAKSLQQGARMKLTFKGSLPVMEQDSFKQWLLNSSSLIKSISERRFASKEIVYEIETDAAPEAIASRLQSLDFKGRKFRTQFNSSEIRMEAL